jgi:hypothetical protein
MVVGSIASFGLRLFSTASGGVNFFSDVGRSDERVAGCGSATEVDRVGLIAFVHCAQHHAESHAARWLPNGYLNRVPARFETEAAVTAGDATKADVALLAIDDQPELGGWLKGQLVVGARVQGAGFRRG